MPILPSHRQGIYYLEYCRVMCKDNRVVYARSEKGVQKFVGIPQKNTSVILLGNGTSITQSAARVLSGENVMVAFTGGGGTPLFLASQNEYRPTKYLQKWVSFWFDPDKRLNIARDFQKERVQLVEKHWGKAGLPDIGMNGIDFITKIHSEKSNASEALLLAEAGYAKALYRLLSKHYGFISFSRNPGMKNVKDPVNSFLDHGNYLAYGLGATVLWVLGIPHSLPVMHGKTRRGALVFDVADIFKDAIIMPTAFEAASKKLNDRDFRILCVERIHSHKVMRHLFRFIEDICTQHGTTDEMP